ncbi:putative oxidoreductase TDA3 [Fusarium oxysporum f. sp. albedinis]|nr:putative oxidoreductase TDA3 [Fusarium oxysporum f. sp. albedinis]
MPREKRASGSQEFLQPDLLVDCIGVVACLHVSLAYPRKQILPEFVASSKVCCFLSFSCKENRDIGPKFSCLSLKCLYLVASPALETLRGP